MKTQRSVLATWAVRACFALVFVVNVQCAVSYLIDPAPYASGFELGGVQGEVAVRGMGVAFLMWNVTYPAFIVSPRRFRVLGWVVLAQQIVGLVGESWILAGLAGWEGPLVSSIVRFIAFDAFGLLIMLVSFAFMMASERREGLRRMGEGNAL